MHAHVFLPPDLATMQQTRQIPPAKSATPAPSRSPCGGRAAPSVEQWPGCPRGCKVATRGCAQVQEGHCHGVHCSRKHKGKAEEDRLAGCVGFPASRPRPLPDIIAPGGNGRPGPARPLTAAGKFLTSCLASQLCPALPRGAGAFVLAVPLPPPHDSWQTRVLFLTTTGTAEAMLPVTSPSTSEGAGWHRASVPVPHLLSTPSLPSASWVDGDPPSCALGPGSLTHPLCALTGVWHHGSGPCLVPGARHSTGAGAGRAGGMWQPRGCRFGGAAALGGMVPPSHSLSRPTHPAQPGSVCSPETPCLDAQGPGKAEEDVTWVLEGCFPL